MTCIVGYKHEDRVYIGGDSAGVSGYSIVVRADEKVFKKDDMIFGFTTSFRMGQIIRYCLHIPDHDPRVDDYKYLCTDFIDALMECYKKKGYELKGKGGDTVGGTFLLGYKGNLYNIQDDFQVGKTVNNFDACGCGEQFAMGAMYILEDSNATPEDKITKALEAASYLSAGVTGPYNIVSV